jgi:hypothetical protein
MQGECVHGSHLRMLLPRLQTWAVEYVARFQKAFRPRVQRLNL